MIVDIHTHISPQNEESIEWRDSVLERRRMLPADGASHDKIQPITNEEWVKEWKEAGIEKVVVLPHDVSRVFKMKIRDETVEKFVREYPDMLIGFSSVEPVDTIGRFKRETLSDVEKAVNEYGFKGLKLLPVYGHYYANDRKVYPLYEKCLELDIPVLLHVSATAIRWCPFKYSNPVVLDDVASDFPDLRLAVAHFGRPWAEELTALLVQHKRMFLDIAACFYRPTWLTWNLVLAKESGILDRVMWGTDGPGISRPAKRAVRWMKTELNEIAKKAGWPTFTEQEINGMLGDNAARYLKL